MNLCIAVRLRLLKPDRWLSIVFQHWDLSYFATILESATENGAEFKAAITQTGDVIWSMHKKKNSESVLAGEMILTFYKPIKKKRIKTRQTHPLSDLNRAAVLDEVFATCLRNGTASFTSEALFNRVILELWERRALGCLSLDRQEFASRLLRRGWRYDQKRHVWEHSTHANAVKEDLLLSLG